MSQAAIFEELKRAVHFTERDARNLMTTGPDFLRKHQNAITDRFYEMLGQVPETRKLIEGRVDQLKQTHRTWFEGLFNGSYGPEYFEQRWRIGLTHVRIGLDPYWVEAVMSLIRVESLAALAQDITDPRDLVDKFSSLCKLLDLDLAIVNLSYNEERLERLTQFTGMKRPLLENIIRMPKK